METTVKHKEDEVAALKAEREKLITAGMEALAREAELRTECKRLRAALEDIDAIVANTPGDFGPMTALNRISNIARRALEEK
jgi:hypothetical protein